MSVHTQGVIQALIRANKPKPAEEEARERKPVVTISRDLGTGGDAISEALAARLNVECYNMEVLDAVAKSTNVNASLLQSLHEKVNKASDAWLYSVVFGKSVSRDDYLSNLVTTVRGIYRKGGIIIGRGGHVILAGRDVLRVRLTGSVEVCGRRYALAQDIGLTEARKTVRERNRARGQFIWKMFKSRVNDPQNFDLVVNMDHFADYDQAVEIIMIAAHALGLTKEAVVAAEV